MLITIIPSDRMQELGETKRIRLSKKTRSILESKVRTRAVVEYELDKNRTPLETKLTIHKPFITDVKDYSAKLAHSEGYYGFVATNSYRQLVDMREAVSPDKLVLVGTDPEFCLSEREDNVCRYAANVLMDVEKTGRFGSDGPCAEIRPKPSSTGLGLIKNMHDCFLIGATRIPNWKWLGGIHHKGEEGRVYTLGGQLHIGEPSDAIIKPAIKYELRPLIIRVLDEVLGIPLTKFEGKDGVVRRNSSQYGKWGDYRVSKNRFEWRSVSAAWLLSPALTETVIELAVNIADAIYKRFLDLEDKNKGNGSLANLAIFKEQIVKEILVLNFPNPVEYNELLKKLGNNPTLASSEYKKVLDNIEQMPGKLGLAHIGHEFEFLKQVSGYVLEDFKPSKDLRDIWLNGAKDPLTEENLATMFSRLTKKEIKTGFKLCEVTKVSDKKLDGVSFPDNETEVDESELDD